MECKNIEWVKWAIDCIKEEDDDAAKVQILLVRMFVKCFIFNLGCVTDIGETWGV